MRVVRRGKIPGANHTSENPYVFDTQMIVPNYASEIQDADRQVAAYMHSCWVELRQDRQAGLRDRAIRPGRPTIRRADQLMRFDATPTVVAHYRKAQLDAQQTAQGAALAP